MIRTPQACYLKKSVSKNIPNPRDLKELLTLVSVDYVKIFQYVSIAMLSFTSPAICSLCACNSRKTCQLAKQLLIVLPNFNGWKVKKKSKELEMFVYN